MDEAAQHGGKDLYHCLPLRRVCQERYSAPHQPGGQARGHCRQHLSGGGEPDHRGPGSGPAHQGQRPVSGRAARPSPKCLRQSFDETLGVTGTCPENSLLFVALGAAFYADKDLGPVRNSGRAAADSAACRRPTAPSRRCFENRGGIRGVPAPATPRRRCRRRDFPADYAPARCISASTPAPPP